MPFDFVTVRAAFSPKILFKLIIYLSSIFQEFLKATVDLVDLVGLHIVMQRVSGKGQVKVRLSFFPFGSERFRKSSISKKTLPVFSISGSRGRTRLGFRRISVHPTHLVMGRSERNRIRLEIHSKEFRRQHRIGK